MSLRRFFHRRRWDQERAREMEAYVDIEIDGNLSRGMTADEARHAALRKLGNPTLIRERIYHMNTVSFFETCWQNLRYAARLLRWNPGFASVAILSLALGIGANTAIFQLLDAVRLRALPVPSPGELALIRIENSHGRCCIFMNRFSYFTNAMWEELEKRQQSFSGVFAWAPDTVNLAQGGRVRTAEAIWVSGSFFPVLKVEPEIGRLLGPADDQRGCGSPGAVISYSFWQREYGGDPSVPGRKLTLQGHPFQITGVAPASFYGVEVGRTFDVALPVCAEKMVKGEQSAVDNRMAWWLVVMGRLKPGLTATRASAEMATLSPSLFAATVPSSFNGDQTKEYLANRLSAFPAGSGISGLRTDYEDPLWLMLATAGLVLLIACANLANLALARATARQREIAVRLAIGASRGRLIGQLLTESLLLASAGAALGLLLSQSLTGLLVQSISTKGNPLFVNLSPDWRMLLFTTGIAMLTCVLFGLAPALRATGADPAVMMKASGRGLTASGDSFSLRRILVVAQIALSLVLLVGALLFSRTLNKLLNLDAGFRQNGMLITNMDLTRMNLPPERRMPAKNDLIARLSTIPGIDSVAGASPTPLSGGAWNQPVVIDHKPGPNSFFAVVTPNYFRTMDTPLLAGRDFNSHDTAGSPKVAIVNRAFARTFFGGANPIGKTFSLESPFEVIGLADDSKYLNLREDPHPIGYFPMAQEEHPGADLALVIHSNLPLASLTSSIQRTIAKVNPDIDIDFTVFKTQVREGLLRERLMAALSSFFGILAGVLATVGLYGVISYMVAQRRSEIGIRMALGAGRAQVLKLILREAALLLAIGSAVGVALALAAGRAASSMLFGLKPYDPLTLAMAVAVLGVAALAAGYLPARRASKMDPMNALREN